jgi:hypothetical protein
VRAAGVLAKGRMRPAGRMFDMPGIYDVELCGTSIPDKKTREFSQNRRQLIDLCCWQRCQVKQCRISEEGVCNLVETVKDL